MGDLTQELPRGAPSLLLRPSPPVAGSGDFACYLEKRPGCFLRLGNGADSPMLHNPRYDFNDELRTVGAAYWTRLAERFLEPA